VQNAKIKNAFVIQMLKQMNEHRILKRAQTLYQKAIEGGFNKDDTTKPH